MVTGYQIAEKTLEAYTGNGGYIWGKLGIEWTAARQKALEKAYKADPKGNADYKLSAQYGAKWIGHMVWDCAGLCWWAANYFGIKIHQGSNLIWSCDLKQKGALAKDQDLPVGALVFTGESVNKHPHIGTYIGNGIVVEANGAIKGVIESKLHCGKWKWWGLVKNVTYEKMDQEPEQTNEPEPTTDDGYPILRRGNKGKYVTLLQVKLISKGYSCGASGADGDFGANTEKAVKLFQKEHDGPDGRALQIDGIVGPATWWALDNAPERITYTVTIKNLTAEQKNKLMKEYAGAIATPED
jgi:hypothetical protein